jgi:uncharacterized membrane protein
MELALSVIGQMASRLSGFKLAGLRTGFFVGGAGSSEGRQFTITWTVVAWLRFPEVPVIVSV